MTQALTRWMVSAVLASEWVRAAGENSLLASSSALPAMTTWMNSEAGGLTGVSASPLRAVLGREVRRGPTLSKCSACSMSCGGQEG